MGTLLEALKNAKLVDPKKAKKAEEVKTEKLRADEDLSKAIVRARAPGDQDRQERQARFQKSAARDTTKQSSNSGSREYLRRFKK